MKNVLLALCCALLIGTTAVYGDGCRVFFGAGYHRAAYVAPIVVKAAPVYYELGAPVQVAAKQTVAMRTDPSYDRFLQFKAYEAGFAASQQQRAAQQAQPQYGAAQQAYAPNGYSGRTTPLMIEHCSNCHGIALEHPKGTNGPFVLDPSVGLTGDQITEVMKRMRLPENHPDVMPPPPAKLPPEAKGAILEEILQLHMKGPNNGQPRLQPIPQPLQQDAAPVPPNAASASR